MTVRELVNELTQSYVDWDKEVFICVTEKPVTNETSRHKRYSIDRCSLVKPDWYLGDECNLVIGKENKSFKVKNMDEKKYVTIEMFEEYHKNLMNYIGMHDDLMLNGETTCPKCGAIITSDKCENCASQNIDKKGE